MSGTVVDTVDTTDVVQRGGTGKGVALALTSTAVPWLIYGLVILRDRIGTRRTGGMEAVLTELVVLAGLGIVGALGFGFLALVRAHRPTGGDGASWQSGPAFTHLAVALTGLLFSGVLALGCRAGSSVDEDAPMGAAPASSPADEAPVEDWEPQIGDCVVYGDDDIGTNVDCARSHHAEIFVLEEHPAPWDAPYPTESLATWVFDRCDRGFEEYVGAPESEVEDLTYSYYRPTRESWEEGDRWVVCSVIRVWEGGLRTGSAKGLKG